MIFGVLALAVVPAIAQNVLLLMFDDARPEFGCYGVDEMYTPNLDALAADPDTVVFERAYVQQAICNPTRSSALTSRRPDTTHVWDLTTAFRAVGGNFTTLPEHFKNSGYISSGAGKVFHPISYEGHTDDVPWSWSTPYFHADSDSIHHFGMGNLSNCFWEVPADVAANDTMFPDGQIAQHTVETIQSLAAADQKFFVASGQHRPHLPFISPAKYWTHYDLNSTELPQYPHKPKDWGAAEYYAWDPESGPRHCHNVAQWNISLPYGELPLEYVREMKRGYRAAVTFSDAQLGKILQALKDSGKWDETTIVFVGDHGWQLGEHAEVGKKTNFEEATRAPLLIKPPKSSSALLRARDEAAARAGVSSEEFRTMHTVRRWSRGLGKYIDVKSCNALVEFVDIFPTVAELSGIEVPPLCPAESRNVSLCTEGFSLVPVIADPSKTTFKAAAFSQYARCMHDIDYPGYYGCLEPNNGVYPKFMGYTMRTLETEDTPSFRYTAWVSFNGTTGVPHWGDVRAEELYDHTNPPPAGMDVEDINLILDPKYEQYLPALRKQLQQGWRALIQE